MWMSRQEVFEVTGPTSGTESWVRIGATREGRIVGAEARYWYEAGAQPGSPFLSGMGTAFSAYDIPNLHVEGWDVVVNKPKVAAYRAPGGPAAVFPVESLLDELARVLGLDPLELRLRNAAVEGTRIVTGQRFGPIGNRQVLEAAARSEHYRSELSGEHRGRGVAAAWWHTGGGESAAYASITADGRVQLVTGSVDIGGQRAGLAMQLAETLGIAVADVHPLVADTASIGYTMSTVGSRTAFASGLAVYECGMDLRRQLEARAAAIWEVDAAGVAYDAERGCVRGPGGRQFAFKELAAQLPATGGLIQGRASVNPGGGGDAFGAHVVDVEVDPDTGKVTILRYTAVQDVGTAVHPAYAEGQLQGGVLQGAGMALSEEYVYGDDGVMRNASMLDYRMPTTVDLPMIETVLVEVPNPEHPFGVRGVSELPIMPPLGAIANAIFDATGVRVRELPASPRVLLEQLLAAE
jgi:CO/xanthine dehydrogenase Mo-binding subunit